MINETSKPQNFQAAKLLLTGGTGFIGKNVLRLLSDKYEITAPRRAELNVVDQLSVDNYLKDKKFDIVLHCAILTPGRNPNDKEEDILDYTMRGLLNLKNHENEFEKIIYIGSGAEFDKSRDIIKAKEEDLGKIIPKDAYGYAKYILTQIARNSKNIYNLRIFGCYGQDEQERRFIRSAITDCLNNRPVSIRQDCVFSYVLVDDLIKITDLIINNTPKFKDYNICNENCYKLSGLAQIVSDKMNNKNGIVIQNSGFNKEYTGDNSRFLNEFRDFKFKNIEDGIEKEIKWLRGISNEETGC